jgi:hypothetical protein
MKSHWKQEILILFTVLAAIWTPLVCLIKTRDYFQIGLLLMLILLICAIVAMLAWGIIRYPELKIELQTRLTNALETIKVRPKSVLALLVLGVVFLLLIVTVVAAVAVGSTYLKDWPRAKSPDEYTPPPSNKADFPISSVTTPSFRVKLITGAGMSASNIIIAISPLEATSQICRGEVSDRTGCATFYNAPTGKYVIIAVSEVRGSAKISSTVISIGEGQTVFNWALASMSPPAAVDVLDAFRLNRFRLEHRHLKILDRFVSDAQSRGSILIFGFTDSRGSEEFNEWLAGRRALVVEEYLHSKHVSENKLRLFTMGERKPAVSEMLGGTPKNRRVVCLLINKSFLDSSEE